MALLTWDDLTPVEKRLCEKAAEGEPLNLRSGRADEDDPARGQQWPAERHIRSALLNQLAIGRRDLEQKAGRPLAVRIQGALLVGPLNLATLALRWPLQLEWCHFAGDVVLTKASAIDLEFLGSWFNGAAVARRLRVDHDLSLQGCSCHDKVDLTEAHIGGSLKCAGAQLSSDAGPALSGDGLTVEGSIFLTEGCTVTGHGEDGAVRLTGAHIGGQLACPGAQLTNDTGPALSADGLTVDGSISLTDGCTATGHGEKGAVRLTGAHIGEVLNCPGAQLSNDTGPALFADRLTVDGGIFLTDGCTATGHGERGAVRLTGAHIGGQLNCLGAQLTNDTGPALSADGLTVDGSITLANGCTATGRGEKGAVRLTGAHIGGQLNCLRAQLTNVTGPALSADRLTVDGSISLTDGCTATGHGESGAVRLTGAHIGGQLMCSGAELSNQIGPVLDLTHADAGPFRLTPGFAAGERWSVELAGLTYQGIPRDGPLDWWLDLLRNHTPAYAAQPWQQLAAVHRAAGHERDARRILIAQQDDRRRRLLRPDSGERFRHRVSLWLYRTYLSLTKLVVGYGYQTWRALIALLLILLTAAGLGLLSGYYHAVPGQHVASHTKATNAPGTPCSTVEQIGLGVDLGLPLIKTNVRARCDLDSSSKPGQWITAGSWVLLVFSWGAATLVVAGYTGVVRRT
jgi:hypothetical protein